jgi:hypothetical protein
MSENVGDSTPHNPKGLHSLYRYNFTFTLQEVRWDGSGTEPAGEYTFFYAKGKENHELGTGFIIYKGITSAVKRAEFVSDRMSYNIKRSLVISSF